ncbi:MAG: LysM peptidoglycan-binding domain-containing protein [Bacteroidales bacterium]|nr:LysM peptidoglycan-binding domain-containing protein [Bacteroidales bacterium]
MEMDSTGTDFTFVHIARVGGVIVSHYKESYYKQRFLLARRLLPDFLTPEPSDSLAGYAFNPENSVLPLKDTLQLAAGDSLIVLLQDGRWLYAGRDGALTVPGQGEKLVLDPDGSWTRISMTKHTVPAPKPANGSVSAVKADGSAAATDPDSQPVYYTVKSGDTLSKIAMRHHTTVRSLCRLNGISENTTLKIGRKLRIR